MVGWPGLTESKLFWHYRAEDKNSELNTDELWADYSRTVWAECQSSLLVFCGADIPGLSPVSRSGFWKAVIRMIRIPCLQRSLHVAFTPKPCQLGHSEHVYTCNDHMRSENATNLITKMSFSFRFRAFVPAWQKSKAITHVSAPGKNHQPQTTHTEQHPFKHSGWKRCNMTQPDLASAFFVLYSIEVPESTEMIQVFV